jgi:hypothetical protein
MPLKRRHIDGDDAGDNENDAARTSEPPSEESRTKRPRLVASHTARRSSTGADLLSPLSDELLVRILAQLPLSYLLSVAPVSRRFHRLAGDSQLWKRLYYERFVLPRALRIPGFRKHDHYYSSRRTAAVWRAVDGRRGSGVGGVGGGTGGAGGWFDMRTRTNGDGDYDWKRQYKLRHNWSRGKCAVEELRVGDTLAVAEPVAIPETNSSSPKMLVKVCEGIAVTADATSGLRAWDLKTKQLVAHVNLVDSTSDASPSCLAIDDQGLQKHQQQQKAIDVAVGFADGSFGVWRLDLERHRLIRRYRHEKSTNGALVGTALSYPYLLTATESVLISLYTFDRPLSETGRGPQPESDTETEAGSEMSGTVGYNTEDDWARRTFYKKTGRPVQSKAPPGTIDLPAPYLLTSLKSHTSRAPLALSIRKTAGTTVASIAYTFSTLQGWSLGIQDLHLKPSLASSKKTTDITTTRLAYTLPVSTAPSQIPSPPTSPARTCQTLRQGGTSDAGVDGPISICYTHPYLLATLPDNTLLLYLCTSTTSSLSISPGIRLWGHTSGISDAEITARGKAVSVSCRGEEIRVWELEGRADGRSIEVRPTTSTSPGVVSNGQETEEHPDISSSFDERRNWVGFDDEMVIVLKESRGRGSLMVYDFT